MLRNRHWILTLLVVALFGLLAGCSGSGSSGTGTSGATAQGIALPSEVSAISAETGASPTALAIHTLASLAADLPADSDYMQTKAAKYVDEPTLEVFGIIETILKAIQQTNYADVGNVAASEADAVPYKAIVAWEEDNNGKSQKEMEEWILKSFLATENSQEINVVHVWIADSEETVKVECKIFQAPAQDAEGTYLDYGKWQINAHFEDPQGDPLGSFFADADVDVDGNTVLRMSDSEARTENIMGTDVDLTSLTKAIVHKTDVAGYGKAIIPNWSYCWDTGGAPSPCADPGFDGNVPSVNVKYAYNQGYMALQGPNGTVYKDRSNPVAINYRYGVFDATTGANVEKSTQFGFPILIQGQGGNSHGYYGAWQGRHQLWSSNNQTPADGTAVEKEVWNNETPVSYTTKTYPGTLTKRSLVAGSLSQVQDIPVEIWLSDNFDLSYDSTLNGNAGGWKKCTMENTGTVDQNGFEIWQPNCAADAFDLSTLIIDQNARKQLFIGGRICDSYGPDTNCSNPQFNFDVGGYFVETQFSQSPGTQFTPAQWKDGDHLWVNVNGSTYIVYDGDFTGGKTGWVEKTLESFDEQTWTPTFAAAGDVPFDFPADREYYINNKGTNFVVRRVDTQNAAGDYDVRIEIQNVVRPDNYSSVLNGVSYLAVEWEDRNDRSTYAFDPATMLLKYASVGSNDSGASIGDVLDHGAWGLVAFDGSDQKLMNNDNRPVQFNWEYATQENPWGAVTYLIKDSDAQIQYLADPLSFDPLVLTTMGNEQVTFSLQFDGWMHGLPDMRQELKKNRFIINDAIKNKIVNIPKGTQVTSGANSYFIKPLEIGIILPKLGAAPVDAPDLTPANSIDLAAFIPPDPVEIGDLPTGLTPRYIEGNAAQ